MLTFVFSLTFGSCLWANTESITESDVKNLVRPGTHLFVFLLPLFPIVCPFIIVCFFSLFVSVDQAR